eukprot:PhF_6_TR31377/c0_g1_i1/m.45952
MSVQQKRSRDAESSVRIVLDAQYPSQETDVSIRLLATQIGTLHGLNHKYLKPSIFQVYGSPALLAKVSKAYRIDQWKDFDFHLDSIEAICQREEGRKVVYLTPEAPDVLEEVDPTATYIIGGLLDRGQIESEAYVSYRKAHSLPGVVFARIPVHRHVQLRNGNSLTIPNVFSILKEIESGKSLLESLKQVLAQRTIIAWKPSCCSHQWLVWRSESQSEVECIECKGRTIIPPELAADFLVTKDSTTGGTWRHVTIPTKPYIPLKYRDDIAMDVFVREMPKVELHSHVNGCIRRETLTDLMRARGLPPPKLTDEITPDKIGKERVAECFQIFTCIHSVVDNIAALRRITKEALEDYIAEKTVYLELRTTPKVFAGSSMREYIDTVLAEMKAVEDKITSNLILSINRGNPVAEADTIVSLAAEYLGKGVVGIDFAGNWFKGVFAEFRPHLERARSLGLKITMHAGEKDDTAELNEMVEFAPDRYGHLMYVDEDNKRKIMESKAPLEVCFTSNLFTGIWEVKDHHFPKWFFQGHRVSLNTDDRGVMTTSMYQEYRLVQRTYHLTKKHLRSIALDSLEHSFAQESTKQKLRGLWNDDE